MDCYSVYHINYQHKPFILISLEKSPEYKQVLLLQIKCIKFTLKVNLLAFTVQSMSAHKYLQCNSMLKDSTDRLKTSTICQDGKAQIHHHSTDTNKLYFEQISQVIYTQWIESLPTMHMYIWAHMHTYKSEDNFGVQKMELRSSGVCGKCPESVPSQRLWIESWEPDTV